LNLSFLFILNKSTEPDCFKMVSFMISFIKLPVKWTATYYQEACQTKVAVIAVSYEKLG
jgi:hypothetical protein